MINIIGAGPAGSYTAYLLSKKGKDVNVFEEHKKIGLPIQCAGVTTSLLEDIIKLKKDIIINKINKARIFSPNKKFIEINLKEENLVIDRNKFDNQLADIAKQQGAKFFLNSKFITNKKDYAIIKSKNKIKKIKFDYLIGADGPLSQVAKSNGLYKKREFWYGIQARVNLKNENIIEFYPYFGTYAWVVPENKDVARVGLVSKRDTNVLFRNFLFKFKKIKQKDIIEHQGGIIPQYNPWIKTQKDNIYLVGDAACQVKATTGGGIIQSLIASKALVDSIINNKKYGIEWRKLLGKELYVHYKSRKMMDKFKEKDWNKLVKEIDRDILENNGRDNISVIITKLLMKKPSLLYFAKHLI